MSFFRRSPADQDIHEEIRSHILHRADDLERSGLSRAEAERRARVEFGGQLRYREEIRDALGGQALGNLLRDVRFSVRVLKKSPGFTVVSALTLALAIGANSVVFAALNAIILRPLDLPQADTLYSVHRVTNKSASQSYPDYADMRDRNRSFDGLAAYNILQVGFDAGDSPSRCWIDAVSGNYFDVLRVQPYLGRFFHASDEHGSNSAPVVVLGYAFWHSRFQGDRSVVGRVVRINKQPLTVIGVAPPGFHGTLLFFTPDFYVPMVNEQQIEGLDILNARGYHFVFMTLGHLKPGVTPGQAAADLDAISLDLEKTYPRDHKHVPVYLDRPSLYVLGAPARAFLSALMLLAGLILLAACANLGSLFAARASDRSREVAMRLALGASRGRILRQLFTEAMLISLTGGALGLWGSLQLLQALSTWQPVPQYPINIPVTPDVSVYVVGLLLAIGSGLLFAAVPVRQVLRTDPYEIVKSSTRATERRFTVRDLLVVAQISISAVLITASLVAVRGLVRSLRSDVGIDPRNVTLAETHLEMAGYSAAAVPPMQKKMVDAMATIPGVTSAALIDEAPLSTGGVESAPVFTEDATDFRPGSARLTPLMFKASARYLQASGTTLLSGRNITDHDDASAPRAAVVNAEFARRMFGSTADATGRYFKMHDGTRIQVVGVVRDGKYESLTEDPQPVIFFSLLQSPSAHTWLLVKSGGDAQQVAAAVRARLRGLDAELPAYIQTWTDGMHLALFPARIATAALGVLGSMGATLSLSGVFGLAAYSVSRRMKELGIRIALGAQRKEVLQAALGRAIKLLAYGSAAGVIGGLLAARVLAMIVYQATPRDPIVLAGVTAVMFLVGVVATWIPAQRALAIDPLALLREE